MTIEKKQRLADLIDILIEYNGEEQKHYEECDEMEKGNHIYNDLKELEEFSKELKQEIIRW
jgi:hypothetical protein